MTIRVCMEGKEIMGVVEDGQPGCAETHGLCRSCMKKNHPGAYYAARRREIADGLAAFDASQGTSDMNTFFFHRMAA